MKKQKSKQKHCTKEITSNTKSKDLNHELLTKPKPAHQHQEAVAAYGHYCGS